MFECESVCVRYFGWCRVVSFFRIESEDLLHIAVSLFLDQRADLVPLLRVCVFEGVWVEWV